MKVKIQILDIIFDTFILIRYEQWCNEYYWIA